MNMTYTDVCQEVQQRKLLLIARGTFPSQLILATDLVDSTQTEEVTQLLQRIDQETAYFLWLKALAHSADLCIAPLLHRLFWKEQDGMICSACRDLRDRYFSKEKHATATIDLREKPEAKILEFKRKAVG